MAADLFQDALTDLATRHGMPVPRLDIARVEAGYRHVARSGIFRVAAVEDRIVALACAIVRDDQWFLSGFWADPRERLRGVGGPLLRQVWEEGRVRGTRTHFVWSSFDVGAIAIYLKLGMLPGTQLFSFGGSILDLPPAGRLSLTPLTPAIAGQIDRDLRGIARPDDHAYLARSGDVGFAVVEGDTPVGYYYIHDGQIGPAGWVRDDLGEQVMVLALRAASTTGDVKFVVPGMNHVAIRVALSAGLRLLHTSHLLWTGPIGHMERYIPSGPLLF